MEHNLTDQEVAHVNALIDHYNDLHPDDQTKLITHAQRGDHASMTAWIKKAAAFLGLPIGASLATLGWFFIKKLK